MCKPWHAANVHFFASCESHFEILLETRWEGLYIHQLCYVYRSSCILTPRGLGFS